MNNITLFQTDGCWFAKHETFVMPMFDGTPNFDLRVAMVSVGGAQGKNQNAWRTNLSVIEVGSYLGFLQGSKLGPGAARRAWLMQWKLSKEVFDLPFMGDGDVDWAKLRERVELDIARNFPLCA